MLLAIDAGNTQTVFGLFSKGKMEALWRIGTRKELTCDELGVWLRLLLSDSGWSVDQIKGVIICSVVPYMNTVLSATCHSSFGLEPLFIGPGVRTGMPIRYENPHEVGADRIVNAVAALHRVGAPVMVLDFGTATTLDVVDAQGDYLGGIIAPGLEISAEALFQRAARLSRVDIRKPDKVIGKTTEASIQSGLYFGYLSLVDGLVRRARTELGVDATVIATGGLAGVFAPELECVQKDIPGLTLEGLHIIWEKNHRR
jgi:type III pantothenate kinase